MGDLNQMRRDRDVAIIGILTSAAETVSKATGKTVSAVLDDPYRYGQGLSVTIVVGESDAVPDPKEDTS